MNTLLKYVFFVSVLLSNTALFSQNEEFKDFWKKFKTDSLFQKSRVMFPLKYKGGMAGEETNTPMQKSGWSFKDADFWEEYELINTSKPSKTEQPANQERTLIYAPEDEGFGSAFYFKLIKGQWFLIRIETWGC